MNFDKYKSLFSGYKWLITSVPRHSKEAYEGISRIWILGVFCLSIQPAMTAVRPDSTPSADEAWWKIVHLVLEAPPGGVSCVLASANAPSGGVLIEKPLQIQEQKKGLYLGKKYALVLLWKTYIY